MRTGSFFSWPERAHCQLRKIPAGIIEVNDSVGKGDSRDRRIEGRRKRYGRASSAEFWFDLGSHRSARVARLVALPGQSAYRNLENTGTWTRGGVLLVRALMANNIED